MRTPCQIADLTPHGPRKAVAALKSGFSGRLGEWGEFDDWGE